MTHSAGEGGAANGERGPGSLPDGVPGAEEIEAVRAGIEAVDRQMVELVAERVELARRAGALKRQDENATLDPGREAAVVRHAVENARDLGLPEEPVRQLFWTLIGLCRSAQLES